MPYTSDGELMAAVRFAKRNSVEGLTISLDLQEYGMDIVFKHARAGQLRTWKKTVHYGHYESGVGEGAILAIREALRVFKLSAQDA